MEGMDTSDDSKLYDIRQTVGMVFQNPDNQIVATVVEEDVALSLIHIYTDFGTKSSVLHLARGVQAPGTHVRSNCPQCAI